MKSDTFLGVITWFAKVAAASWRGDKLFDL